MTGVPIDVVEVLERSSARIVLLDDAGATIATVAPAEVLEAGRRVAAGLARAGVTRGSRIGVWMRNGARYLETLAACAVGGYVAVSVNTRYGPPEAAELVERAGARLLAVDASTAGQGSATGVEMIDDGRHALLAATTEIDLQPVDRPTAPFVVFTTSGTTSRPKLVLHHQRSIAVHAAQVASSLPVHRDDVVLIAMPLCGVFGLTSLTSAVAGDATVLVPPSFEVGSARTAIETHRVTMVHGSDDMFHRLIEAGADLSSIRAGGYARFNTSLDGLVARADAAGARLMGLYGMSEVQALFAGRDPSRPLAEREPAGGRLLSPDAEHRIVDGELQVRGPSLFAGYLAEGGARVDAELTAAAHDGGWFRTGDLAHDDGARSFTYVARMGDAMRLGGFLVAPSEIESVLVELDGIDAAQVVEVDRPTGARPVAFVIAPGGIDEDAAIAHCRERLARYKCPVRVVAVDEFPVTMSANGTKIRRTELRARAVELIDG